MGHDPTALIVHDPRVFNRFVYERLLAGRYKHWCTIVRFHRVYGLTPLVRRLYGVPKDHAVASDEKDMLLALWEHHNQELIEHLRGHIATAFANPMLVSDYYQDTIDVFLTEDECGNNLLGSVLLLASLIGFNNVPHGRELLKQLQSVVSDGGCHRTVFDGLNDGGESVHTLFQTIPLQERERIRRWTHPLLAPGSTRR